MSAMGDSDLREFVRRRMVFTMLANLYGVSDEAQQRVAYGVLDSEKSVALTLDDERTRQMVGEVLSDLLAEGLAERGETGGFHGTDLLMETGFDEVASEDARLVLLDAKVRLMHEQGTLKEAMAKGELAPFEMAWAEQHLLRLATADRVDFAVHRPRHEAGR